MMTTGVLLAILLSSQAQIEPASEDELRALISKISSTEEIDVSDETSEYVARHITDLDLWETIRSAASQQNQVFARSASLHLIATYLIVEDFYLQRNEVDVGRVRVEGLAALNRFVLELSKSEKMASVSSYVAEELGFGAATVRRRNNYGRIIASSSPENSEVLVRRDEEEDHFLGPSGEEIILLAGTWTIVFQKQDYRECTKSATIRGGRLTQVSCRLQPAS